MALEDLDMKDTTIAFKMRTNSLLYKVCATIPFWEAVLNQTQKS